MRWLPFNIRLSNRRNFLEIIATNVAEVKAISRSNASRIELCSELNFGGVTPNYQIIKESCEVSKLPLAVLVRPQQDGFCYSKVVFQKMLRDVEWIIHHTRASEIVIGMLTRNNAINYSQLKMVLNMTNNRKIRVAFHRAFDLVHDWKAAAVELSRMGVSRILTAGNYQRAIEDNLPQLEELNKIIQVTAGGGISPRNYEKIFSSSLNQFHLGSFVREMSLEGNPHVVISRINNLVVRKF